MDHVVRAFCVLFFRLGFGYTRPCARRVNVVSREISKAESRKRPRYVGGPAQK